jgi:nitric oxide reductase NorE protein
VIDWSAGERLSRPRPRRTSSVPGEAGVWVLVAGDLLVFSLFFVVFVHERGRDPAGYEAVRRQLSLAVGTFDTLVLLTGSILVVSAVEALRRAAPATARRMLVAAAGCGALFALAKIGEWVHLAHSGHTPRADDFSMYYFVFTGIHLAHLGVATGLLVLARRIAGRPDPAPRDVDVVDAIGIFWHLVDLLWLVLFALLYLMR